MPPEPEGTFRTELLGQLLAAQNQLEAQMSELRRVAADPGLIAECGTQLSFLSNLQQNIATATPATMASMHAEIAASMNAVAGIAQQARIAANDVALGSAQLAATTAATRQTVTDLSSDLYERRIFDPYLKFASPEDEAEYRKREAENQRYIREQLEKKTPEGTLNAAGGAADQMLDANAHGAGDSPDFALRWQRLRKDLDNQRSAVKAEGKSTEECDNRIKASVRRFLRDKGVPESEIDAKLRAVADPLDAAEPYMNGAKDAATLQANIDAGNKQLQADPAIKSAEPVTPDKNVAGLDAIAASLQSSGVTLADTAAPEGHGVNATAIDPKAVGRAV